MSFSSVESAQYLGNLREFYRFVYLSTTLRYTNSTNDTVISGAGAPIDGTYTATPISMSEPEHARDGGSLRIQINVPRDNAVAGLFKSIVPDSDVAVSVYRKHESDSQVITWFPGYVLSCDWKESVAVLTCEPTLSRIRRLGLRQKFQPTCNLELYGTRCGVDRNLFKSTVTVTAVSGRVVTVSGLPAVAADYFNAGYMQKADGSKRFIETRSGNDITLLLPFDSLAVSSSVDVFAGCDRQHTTCRTKFNNIVNHFGFFTVPIRNPFTQGGLSGGAGPTGFAALGD